MRAASALGLTVLVLVLAGPPTGTLAQPTTPGGRPALGSDTVVIATGRDPETLNPLFTQAFIADVVASTLFTFDVARDQNWKPFPQGVAYLPTLADGTWRLDGEQMILRWKIRPRAWHDGRSVTCSDYVFTYTVMRDERVPVSASRPRRVGNLSCPEGAAGRSVTVTWKEPYAYANLTVNGSGVPFQVPRHLLEPFYRANPSRLADAPYGFDPQTTVGDGPYRLVEWRKTESWTVEAVPNHPIFGTPKIKRITWRIPTSAQAFFDALYSGTIDAVSVVSAFEDPREIERQKPGWLMITYEPGTFTEILQFNLDHPLLRDLRVRRAIAHAINRTQLTQEVWNGRNPVADAYLPVKHPGYTAQVQRYPYDPARARALLQEAGFTPGPDGIVRNAAGARGSFQVGAYPEGEVSGNVYAGGGFRRTKAERVLQEQLRQVGIELTVANVPSSRLFRREVLQPRRFQLAMRSLVLGMMSDCDGLFTTDGVPGEENGWEGRNYSGYSTPEMDRICKAIVRELDAAKRTALLQESARLVARDLPILPLYTLTEIGIHKAGLRNYSINLAWGIPIETWNAYAWSWE